MVIFNQQNIPDLASAQWWVYPRHPANKRTEEYLQQGRLSDHIGRAFFLGLVAILPFITQQITGVQIGLSATALLIVVGVAVDTMRQLEAQLVMRNYEGFINRWYVNLATEGTAIMEHDRKVLTMPSVVSVVTGISGVAGLLDDKRRELHGCHSAWRAWRR